MLLQSSCVVELSHEGMLKYLTTCTKANVQEEDTNWQQVIVLR